MALTYDGIVHAFLVALPELEGSAGDVDRAHAYSFFGHMCFALVGYRQRERRDDDAFWLRFGAFLDAMARSRDVEVQKLLRRVVLPILVGEALIVDRLAPSFSTPLRELLARSARDPSVGGATPGPRAGRG